MKNHSKYQTERQDLIEKENKYQIQSQSQRKKLSENELTSSDQFYMDLFFLKPFKVLIENLPKPKLITNCQKYNVNKKYFFIWNFYEMLV